MLLSPHMQLVILTWAKNEADVIESFVRHHAAFADRIIIVDNGSTDDTGEILRKLQVEGLPIDVRTNKTLFHRQAGALNELMEELDDPDWVLPLDADEFLRADNGDVRATLAALSTDAVPLIRWQSYVRVPGDSDEPNILKRITHRKKTEFPQWTKIAIPQSFFRLNPWIAPGNHTLLDRATRRDFDYKIADGLHIAHFPVRSAEQIARKILCSWPAAYADPKRLPGNSYHWKALFDEIRLNGLPTPEKVSEYGRYYGTERHWNAYKKSDAHVPVFGTLKTALQSNETPDHESLVHDPVPSTFDIRYPHAPINPWNDLALMTEQMAAETARLRRQTDEN